ncbi:MAG: NifU family protein [Chloroflexota bacterium]|nr:NifU family protein [Chloroflexota bacterium]
MTEETTPQPEYTVEQIVAAISQQIEVSHGGWVEFVDYDGKVLSVRLQGNCVGCPMSQYTLAMGIGETVKQFFPELESVQAVP